LPRGRRDLFGNGGGTAMTRREEPVSLLSAGLSHLMMASALAIAAVPFIFALPDQPTPPAKIAAGTPSAQAPAAQPPAAEPPATAQPAEPPKDEWPKDEIAKATEQCTHLLSAVAAEVEYLEPIKKGECGLPAPVRLKSLGSDKKVVFDPPVDINCPMVVALNKWIKSTLQPKAVAGLKSSVTTIVNASGYSCRNVYGLPNAKLSQHALANAIDIGGFKLADGRTIKVLRGWGMTERDKVALAKAKAKAEAEAKKAAEAKAAEAKAARAKGTDTASKGDVAAATNGDKRTVPVTKASLTLNPGKKDAPTSEADGKSAPDKTVIPADPPKPTAENLFLRAVHDGACKDFGTVLGPEANDPHRNHFHLDLTPRRRHGICE
jgi:hypothetical protein